MTDAIKNKNITMQHDDLSNNDSLPAEIRIKHLEREAGFVRDYVRKNNTYIIIWMACSIVALVLSIIALAAAISVH